MKEIKSTSLCSGVETESKARDLTVVRKILLLGRKESRTVSASTIVRGI